MGSFQPILESATPDQLASIPQWYAVHTRAKHEKRVAAELARKQITTFLPLITEIHKWSDRKAKVEVPLFSCYLFVNIDPSAEARISVLRIPGVLTFVGGNHRGAAVPDQEIESIQALLARKVPFAPHPFLQVGQRVRVRGGALDGIEGVLERCGAGGSRLVLSVQTIQRSLSISIEGYDVEPVGSIKRIS